MIALALAGALATTGCVSVESTKKQLESGDPQQIAEAEKNIYQIGATRGYPLEKRISYVQLTTNLDLLTRIFPYVSASAADRDIGIAVAKQMDFSKESAIVDFIKNWEESIRRYGSRRIDGAVMRVLIGRMLETATVDGLVNAAKYMHNGSSREFYELEEPVALRLAQVATDQELLAQIVNGDDVVTSKESVNVALSKLTDQNKLMTLYCKYQNPHDKILAKLEVATICDFIQNDPRFKEVSEWNKSGSDIVGKLYNRIKDEDESLLAKILIAKDDDVGAKDILFQMEDAKLIARVVVGAKNKNIREEAAWKLKSYNEIASILMSGQVADEDLQLILVKRIKDGAADVKLYDAVKNLSVRKAIMGKLPKDSRIEIRSRSRAECEKLIANAKGKGSETFELAGFYLGMDIDDVEKLIGYYFPDYEITEKRDGTNADSAYVVYISKQATPFCYASAKDKKVYQFNFGKQVLKKWYKYDAQDYRAWARMYSRENKVDMKYKMIDKEAEVYEQDLSASYKVWFHQESYQYKHNAKEYRLTYFGEEKDYTAHGGIGGVVIKAMAAREFRYIRDDPGTLRAAIERD